jgi:hypothetical protein
MKFSGDQTDVTALVRYAQDLEAENERLRAALEPFVRGLDIYETGIRITENRPPPDDEEVAKYVYVGDQRMARTALNQQITEGK